jgi:hypothetical protein
MPIFKPRMSPISAFSKSGTGRLAEVESFGSKPDIEVSIAAASLTLRAIGPA